MENSPSENQLLVGAHMSTEGGLFRAVERGAQIGCTAIQLFTRNPSQWFSPPLSEKDVTEFRDAVSRTKMAAVVAHDSYLINLASPDASLRKRSIAAMLDELDRASALGIPLLVTHLGAHTGQGEENGLQTLVDSLDEVTDARPDAPVSVCLETTAGQGTSLGWAFEHIAWVLSKLSAPGRFRTCFDTCHVFAAGYDLVTRDAYEKTWREFDKVVGIRYLAVMHLNDAKKELGSRVDRHAHIGKGEIGEGAFRRIMQDPELRGIPKILETPESETMHAVNLSVLRELAARTG
ncbi:MAG TPA: deoxyribonuclease IV [Candidatus Latescibacteria bacterium]|nr:deoxyribonuclease IV [Candidatus Latescibacterota bacterium]